MAGQFSSVSPSTLNLTVGGSKKLGLYVEGTGITEPIDVTTSSSYTYTVTSSDTSVATVDNNGNVFGIGVGTAEITLIVDQVENTGGNVATVTVTAAPSGTRYLDKTGLSTYHNKIKNGLNSVPIGTIVNYDGTTVPSGWTQVNETDDYSTTETVTGKHWIDGKPIYKVTVNLGNVASGGTVQKNNVVSNLSKLVSMTGVAYSTDFSQWYNIPNTHSDIVKYYINAILISPNLQVRVGNGFTNGISNIYVTIEYTKTTD